MAIAVALTGSDQAAWTGQGHYFGFTMRENAGSAAAIAKIYDGTSASGPLLDTVYLAANGSRSEWYGPQGITLTNGGIYVDVSGTGVIEGSVRVG